MNTNVTVGWTYVLTPAASAASTRMAEAPARSQSFWRHASRVCAGSRSRARSRGRRGVSLYRLARPAAGSLRGDGGSRWRLTSRPVTRRALNSSAVGGELTPLILRRHRPQPHRRGSYVVSGHAVASSGCPPRFPRFLAADASQRPAHGNLLPPVDGGLLSAAVTTSQLRVRVPTWRNLLPSGTGRIGRIDPLMPTNLRCELGTRGDIQLGEHVCEMRLYRPA